MSESPTGGSRPAALTAIPSPRAFLTRSSAVVTESPCSLQSPGRLARKMSSLPSPLWLLLDLRQHTTDHLGVGAQCYIVAQQVAVATEALLGEILMRPRVR